MGQNFLINKNKIGEIVSALELKDGDTVVEIGPGHGELTKELRIRNKELRIIAIEKDENLARNLENEIGDEKTKIVEGDGLKILPSIIHNPLFKIQKYKLVGNIPYYITGFLLRILGELELKPERIVLTVQKEVAERICGGMNPVRNLARAACAPEGPAGRAISNGMNLLAASVQFWARPEIVGFIPKRDFSPEPKVDSAIIRLMTKDFRPMTNDTENYYKLIKILFKQPRKTILNNLLSGYAVPKKELVQKIESAGAAPNKRPQNLNPKDIINMSRLF